MNTLHTLSLHDFFKAYTIYVSIIVNKPRRKRNKNVFPTPTLQIQVCLDPQSTSFLMIKGCYILTLNHKGNHLELQQRKFTLNIVRPCSKFPYTSKNPKATFEREWKLRLRS